MHKTSKFGDITNSNILTNSPQNYDSLSCWGLGCRIDVDDVLVVLFIIWFRKGWKVMEQIGMIPKECSDLCTNLVLACTSIAVLVHYTQELPVCVILHILEPPSHFVHKLNCLTQCFSSSSFHASHNQGTSWISRLRLWVVNYL